MARPGLLLLLLLLASPPLQPSSLPRPDTAEGKATLVGLILSALERATLFLEERLPGINLDGVVGFQVLEVQLRGVEERWTPDPLLRPLSLRTRKLADRLEALLRRSIFYLKLSDPTYLREFRPSLQPGFWKLPRTWTHTDASLVYPALEPADSFSEESSDACLDQQQPALRDLRLLRDTHDPTQLLRLQAVPPAAVLPLGQNARMHEGTVRPGSALHQGLLCQHDGPEPESRGHRIRLPHPGPLHGKHHVLWNQWLLRLLQAPVAGGHSQLAEASGGMLREACCQEGGPPQSPCAPAACSESEAARETIYRWLLLP
ncbi:UPF0764 protein C16orf89 homolog isoform X2 [Sciurus carolinensis]|uniref:UPF0764 protein C16orf89 homolog isoform X2 n=1 Tax=Sciurus carolinensis TaxID=30640 RepID=UPI001FB23291|nr:UPF0764 protein C16orf89 homolog isoform X2 [Sciurus carolinensis]